MYFGAEDSGDCRLMYSVRSGGHLNHLPIASVVSANWVDTTGNRSVTVAARKLLLQQRVRDRAARVSKPFIVSSYLSDSTLACGFGLGYRGFHLCLVGGEKFRGFRFKSHHQNRLRIRRAD